MISTVQTEAQPEYLPARMVNEYVYCPRLFYYEWVEGVFVDNRETVEGSLRHSKLDAKEDGLPSPEEMEASEEKIHSRSVMLSSHTHQLIAKLDLIEGQDGLVTPVDYKRGSPRKDDDGSIVAWDPDRVQLAVQAIVLRENGYRCEQGVIYYVATKQRVQFWMGDKVRHRLGRHLLRRHEAARDRRYRRGTGSRNAGRRHGCAGSGRIETDSATAGR